MSWKIIIFFVLEFLMKSNFAQSGLSCQTPNGETARCISIYSCRILRDAVRTQNPQQIRFLRESQCGYDISPLVCCGSADNYNNGPTTKKPNGRLDRLRTPNRLLPDRKTCGFQNSERILNGEDTALEEFPWMALLHYRKRSGDLAFSCGGTLISSRYILTAAHCVKGRILTKVGPLVSARLGEWSTDANVDCISSSGFQLCNDPSVDIDVEKTIAHPDYNDNNINRYHDIALVRLSRQVQYTDYIKAICLPTETEQSSVGARLVVSGWGRTENNTSSSVKQKLRVPIVSTSQCGNRFRSAGVTLDDGQLCAGGERGKDSCTGDSGGPLMNTTKEDRAQWYIEGIVSFGANCGSEGWPGVYTRVSEYLNWIDDNIKE